MSMVFIIFLHRLGDEGKPFISTAQARVLMRQLKIVPVHTNIEETL